MTDKVTKGSAVADVDASGALKREESLFRNTIEAGGKYAPAKGRYILYASYGCPLASRCTAYLVAKGLESVIDLAVVSPVWGATRPGVDDERGWVFDPSFPGATPDPLGLFKSVRDIYELSMKNTGDSLNVPDTVPILFDRETRTVVNNESSEIIRIFNSAFNEFATHPEVDLAPPELLASIDAMNERTFEPICNGVYKCGYAQTQGAYDDAVKTVFSAIDDVEELLSKQRYLVSDTRITEADIRLFCCLVRFDEVYAVLFKCNKRLIREYPHIMEWMRDISQTLKLAPTVNLLHVTHHYYRSDPSINPFSIVPVGCSFVELLEQPMKRKALA